MSSPQGNQLALDSKEAETDYLVFINQKTFADNPYDLDSFAGGAGAALDWP